MTVEILGRREDQRLELKSKGALEEPSKIAREVVAMLNSDGGEVWIGVEEEDGVAAAIDPVSEPDRARDRLRDYLVDALDPSPTADEVSIDLVPAGTGSALLVVKARPADEGSGRTPYAFRKAGGWHFVRRVGARNHPMSRQEIFGRPRETTGEALLDGARRELERTRREFRDSGQSGLWLALQPARTLDIDPEDPLFDRITLDPSVTGNRPSGWHFARSSQNPKITKDGIEWGLWSELHRGYVSWTKVSESGGLRFWTALERLHRKGENREIWPLVLLEYPISAFRIARVLYDGRLEPGDPVAADLALFGVAGWGLREGTPGDFFAANDLVRIEEPDLIWEPDSFTFHEIQESPDRCGFRLVRRVYHAFGWREEDMPRQYDRETGRLILPE